MFHALRTLLLSCREAARASVRTLHIPPEQASQVDNSEPKLSQLLSLLPNLHALIASNVRLFDHSALLSLASAPPVQLRLLIARNCQNATARSLSNLIFELPNLQYLDLSYTKVCTSAPSVDALFIDALFHARQIRVLRLRRTGLRAHSLKRLLLDSPDVRRHGPSELQCLDIRDNDINLSQLSLPESARPSQTNPRNHLDARNYEAALRKQLTGIRPESHDIQDLSKGGIPVLYLSGNRSLRPDLIALAKPILLDISSEQVIPQCCSDHSSRTWATIVANADDLVELRMYAPSLESFSLPVYPRPQSDSDPSVSELPPTYEAAVGQQALPERMDVFLRSFESLRTLRLTCIPASAETETAVSAVTDLLRAAALAANDAALQAQDDFAAGDLLPNETVAQRFKQLFPLEEIILEVQAQGVPDKQSPGGEDQDAQLLRQAGQDDFSFFKDEKPAPVRLQADAKGSPSAAVDVVKALIEWRTARKSAWLARDADTQNELAEEYWPGRVLIVPVSRYTEEPVQEEEDTFSRLWSQS